MLRSDAPQSIAGTYANGSAAAEPYLCLHANSDEFRSPLYSMAFAFQPQHRLLAQSCWATRILLNATMEICSCGEA